MSIKPPLWLAAKATVEVGVLLPKMQGVQVMPIIMQLIYIYSELWPLLPQTF